MENKSLSKVIAEKHGVDKDIARKIIGDVSTFFIAYINMFMTNYYNATKNKDGAAALYILQLEFKKYLGGLNEPS